jgi:hypothetical protein
MPRLPVSSIARIGYPAWTFSPTLVTITVTTPLAGARKIVLSSPRSSTARIGDGELLPGRPGFVGLSFGDVGVRARNVVFGMVEGMLRGGVAARQVGNARELQSRVFQPRFRRGDLGRERGDLLRARAGIDVVAASHPAAKPRAHAPLMAAGGCGLK